MFYKTGSLKCFPNPCQNKGICKPKATLFECICQTDFSGELCQKGKNAITMPNYDTLHRVIYGI